MTAWAFALGCLVGLVLGAVWSQGILIRTLEEMDFPCP